MRCYSIAKPLLHLLPPERAHTLGLWALQNHVLPAAHLAPSTMLAANYFGLTFAHPLGLAAGFDKNAAATTPLLQQGFSFVEAGTVTPKPQEGNPKPRVFRLPEDAAIINRLGFNNDGLEPFVAAMQKRDKLAGIVGANIGKNKDSEDAAADYVIGLARVYDYADYITINISSPNTQGLRALQKREALEQLLASLNKKRAELNAQTNRYVPMLLKIAPDLDEPDLEDIVQAVLSHGFDAIIISNTTIKRPRTLKSAYHGQQGGLSGKPLFASSTEILSRMYRLTGGKIPLIGVGGISSADDAYVKIRSGASLLQLYSALVYQGFGLVRDIVEGLPVLLARDGFTHVSEAIGVDCR